MKRNLKIIDCMYICLDHVSDISGLAKAEKLNRITLSGGSITDFSVLCGLENLREICIENNPVKDISYFKDMNLDTLYLEDTNVSDEQKINLIKTNDIELPVGFIENINLKPAEMIKAEIVIKDSKIAKSGIDGVQKKYSCFDDHVIGMMPGETTYSVMYKGKEIATGKIKVVPSEVKNPQSHLSGIKVDKIFREYRNDNYIPGILTEDDKYYNYKDGELVLVADDVKTVYPLYGGPDDNLYILKNDGSFTIEGESVFDKDTKVSQICGDAAITEDGSFWIIDLSGEEIQPVKMDSNCEKITDNGLIYKKDGTVLYRYYYDNIYEMGKMNIVQVFEKNNLDKMILDDEGNVWHLDQSGADKSPMLELAAKNGVKLGAVDKSGRVVYATAEGKVYYCDDGTQNTSVTADDIVEDHDYFYCRIPDGPYEKDEEYSFIDEATVAGVDVYYSQIKYGRSLLYPDKTLCMTCLGRHMAVSDVKNSYGAFYDKTANDFIILIERNDNTLWEYRIAADTLTQVTEKKSEEAKTTEVPVTTTEAPATTTQEPVTTTKIPDATATQPEEKLKVSDVISLIRYMTGVSTLTDSQVKKYDTWR